MNDDTPAIRNFQRLVMTGRSGRILTTGSSLTPYPEWSEGSAASGGIVAFNGEVFVATTVVGAAAAAGESVVTAESGGSVASGAILMVEAGGFISALPSGHIHVPSPFDSDDAASKGYVDDLVGTIVASGGGITMAYADLRYINASGDVMEGHLSQPLAPTASGHVTNKAYVDSVAGGGGGDTFVAASSSQPVTDTNTIVFVDSTSAPVDITLPSTHTAGTRITVKDFGPDGLGNTTTNLVRVVPGGAAKIEGVASPLALTQNGESGTLVSNGTHWGRV